MVAGPFTVIESPEPESLPSHMLHGLAKQNENWLEADPFTPYDAVADQREGLGVLWFR